MALTKLPKNAIADGAIDDSKIEDGTIQNQEIQGSLTNEKFAGSIANDRLANSSITVAGSTVSLGASTTIATDTDWQALTVADGSTQVITEAGKGYFLDTNAGVIEVFLPSSPTRGDTVVLADYAGTFGTNQIIINTGGENIDSTVGSEFKVTTNNAIVECVYVDAAKGWLVYLNQAAGTTPSSVINDAGGYDTVLPAYISATGGTIATSGDYKTHIFTGDGCFVVSDTGNQGADVDYLVVAGGGGGGRDQFAPAVRVGGGGGAGGFRISNCTTRSCLPAPTMSPLVTTTGITVTATTYPITVGGGGTAGSPSDYTGGRGNNSIFSTITSTGGGGGQGHTPSGDGPLTATPGGSGGATQDNLRPSGLGGMGNTPPTSPSQGNPAGVPSGFNGGGGGGAGAVGGTAPGGPVAGGNGGIGSFISDTFIGPTAPSYGEAGPVSSVRYFAGGGGSKECGTGGDGGGANFQSSASANMGGGGGGARGLDGGSGGKGIVMIRYKFQ